MSVHVQVGKYENCHVAFEAVDVSVGTLPKGSAWRKGAIRLESATRVH